MFEGTCEEKMDYGQTYKPERIVKVIKKDGSTEEFNVSRLFPRLEKVRIVH